MNHLDQLAKSESQEQAVLIERISKAKDSLPEGKNLLNLDIITTAFGSRASTGKMELTNIQKTNFEKQYYLLYPNLKSTEEFIAKLTELEDHSAN